MSNHINTFQYSELSVFCWATLGLCWTFLIVFDGKPKLSRKTACVCTMRGANSYMCVMCGLCRIASKILWSERKKEIWTGLDRDRTVTVPWPYRDKTRLWRVKTKLWRGKATLCRDLPLPKISKPRCFSVSLSKQKANHVEKKRFDQRNDWQLKWSCFGCAPTVHVWLKEENPWNWYMILYTHDLYKHIMTQQRPNIVLKWFNITHSIQNIEMHRNDLTCYIVYICI